MKTPAVGWMEWRERRGGGSRALLGEGSVQRDTSSGHMCTLNTTHYTRESIQQNKTTTLKQYLRYDFL